MKTRKTAKAAHNKAACYSISLPAWYRPLLMAIDPKSNSRALRILVTHALQNGAAQRLLNLPDGLVDLEAIAAQVMAGRTLAQRCGGWRKMQTYLEVHPDLVGTTAQHNPAQPTPLPQPLTADEAFAMWGDDDDEPPTQVNPAPYIPTQVAHYIPAAPITAAPVSRSTASTIAQTEALMLEIQQGFSMPPP
jgi:hypothetical protein